MEQVCVSNILFFSVLFLLILVILYFQFFNPLKSSTSCNSCNTNNNNELSQQKQPIIIQKSIEPLHDPILGLDYARLKDPLVEPGRRIERSQIPPYYFNAINNLETRGYPDNYTLYGLLIKIDDNNKRQRRQQHDRNHKEGPYDDKYSSDYDDKLENDKVNITINNNDPMKILQLFGRQLYSGSNQYEYYAMTTDTIHRIKFDIEKRNNREIFDHDVIHIPHLNGKYKVELYKQDLVRYVPYL